MLGSPLFKAVCVSALTATVKVLNNLHRGLHSLLANSYKGVRHLQCACRAFA